MGIPANPPAFPHVTQSKRAGSETIYTHVAEGMTLRDYFAGQALAGGLIAHHGYPLPVDDVAHSAFGIADAMLAARTPS